MSKEESEWTPDEDAIIKLGDMAFCHDCGKIINRARDEYLTSRPNIFRFRIRCKECGEHHQKFLRAEFMEKWHNKKKMEDS